MAPKMKWISSWLVCFLFLCITIKQGSSRPVNVARSSMNAQQWATQVCTLNTFPAHQCPSEWSGDELYGYLLVYFRDANEQVNFGLSVGNDPYNFTLFNDGVEPVLTSDVGSRHTRDPFLVRSPDKRRNWIIATDNSLAAFNGDFDRAQRVASRQITIYESQGASLTQWKAARLSTPLAGPWSGAVSAPEAYWDDASQTYVVTFGSNRFAEDDINHTGNLTHSQIYFVRTTDFQSFTEPKMYYNISDGGLSDLTVASLGKPGAYVRFFRDDTDNVFSIRGQKTDGGLFGEWTDIEKDGKRFVSESSGEAPKGSNGGPLLFRDNKDETLWHIWLDYFVGGYVPFETNEVTEYGYHLSKQPSFPKDLKQGSVTPLTCAEYKELKVAKF